MTEKFEMATAPVDGGWVLAFDPSRSADDSGLVPWVIATRCDEGWHDEDGYIVTPTHWAPLPDPKPRHTSWRKPEGKIVILRARIRETGWQGWCLKFVLPDGREDNTRDLCLRDTIEGAREKAAELAGPWGLAVEEDHRPMPSASVVPITAGRRQ